MSPPAGRDGGSDGGPRDCTWPMSRPSRTPARISRRSSNRGAVRELAPMRDKVQVAPAGARPAHANDGRPRAIEKLRAEQTPQWMPEQARRPGDRRWPGAHPDQRKKPRRYCRRSAPGGLPAPVASLDCGGAPHSLIEDDLRRRDGHEPPGRAGSVTMRRLAAPRQRAGRDAFGALIRPDAVDWTGWRSAAGSGPAPERRSQVDGARRRHGPGGRPRDGATLPARCSSRASCWPASRDPAGAAARSCATCCASAGCRPRRARVVGAARAHELSACAAARAGATCGPRDVARSDHGPHQASGWKFDRLIDVHIPAHPRAIEDNSSPAASSGARRRVTFLRRRRIDSAP